MLILTLTGILLIRRAVSLFAPNFAQASTSAATFRGSLDVTSWGLGALAGDCVARTRGGRGGNRLVDVLLVKFTQY